MNFNHEQRWVGWSEPCVSYTGSWYNATPCNTISFWSILYNTMQYRYNTTSHTFPHFISQNLCSEPRVRSWQNMETAKQRGLCRHIGVSNYPVELMKDIWRSTNMFPLSDSSLQIFTIFWWSKIVFLKLQTSWRLFGRRSMSTRLSRSTMSNKNCIQWRNSEMSKSTRGRPKCRWLDTEQAVWRANMSIHHDGCVKACLKMFRNITEYLTLPSLII